MEQPKSHLKALSPYIVLHADALSGLLNTLTAEGSTSAQKYYAIHRKIALLKMVLFLVEQELAWQEADEAKGNWTL